MKTSASILLCRQEKKIYPLTVLWQTACILFGNSILPDQVMAVSQQAKLPDIFLIQRKKMQ